MLDTLSLHDHCILDLDDICIPPCSCLAPVEIGKAEVIRLTCVARGSPNTHNITRRYLYSLKAVCRMETYEPFLLSSNSLRPGCVPLGTRMRSGSRQ